MARPRKPVAVIEAQGNTDHRTKAQLKKRRAEEVKPTDTSAAIPNYIAADKDLSSRFAFYAAALQDLGIWSLVDSEELARYISAEDLYEAYTTELRRALSDGRIDDAEGLQRQQDKAYRQAHTSATSLGLNISGRCKLIVPKQEQRPQTDF